MLAPPCYESCVALARSLSSGNSVSNRLSDELTLITLDRVSALFGKAKLPTRRSVDEILLKPSPNAIPRCELLFGRSVRGRVSSAARLSWRRHSTTEHDQRQIRSPLQPPQNGIVTN
jgi:hypothetical protein